jgi:glutaredoxin
MISRMMKFFGLVGLLAFTLIVNAQQYRWVDEKGRVHYSDTPPPPSAKDAKKKDLKGNAVGAQQSYELTKAMQESPVTLYTHPDCKDACQLARDVLNKRGIPFKEVQTVDPQGLEKLKALSGGITVPVMVVGALVEKSVSENAFNSALDVAGYPRPGVAKAREQKAPPPPPPPPALPGNTSVEQPAAPQPEATPYTGRRGGR